MRRRDLGALLGAAVLAVSGVMALPLGAAAQDAPATTEPTSTDRPDPSGTPEPSGSTSPEPSASTTPEPTPSTSPSTSPSATPGEGKVRAVDDAVFVWSVNQQSNAQSHNPITDNFFSAGAANPGRGGMVLSSSRWKASEGNVEIQKVDRNGVWRTATWKGLGTDAAGEKIGLYGPFSGHRVRITRGTGVIDPSTDSATVQWKGTFTVVYYGGNTVFTLTDPKITVRNGVGRLSATGGGWASDRFDPTVWEPVAPAEVPVVELSGVKVSDEGITVTPGYRGVSVNGPETQLRTGEHWGSFPQEFVTFLEPMGAAQFWYSTGLQSDWTKLPEPISVGWAGAEPETPSTPTASATPTAKPTNPVKTPPPTVTATVTATPAPSAAPAPVAQVPLPSSVPSATAPEPAVQAAGAPVQVTAEVGDLVASPASARTDDEAQAWFLGGGLLLAAAALLLVPTLGRRPQT